MPHYCFYFSIIGHGLKYSLAIYISSSVIYLSIYLLCPFFCWAELSYWLSKPLHNIVKYIRRYILQIYIKSICVLFRDKWFQWLVRLALFPFWNGAHRSHRLSCGGGMQSPRPEGGCRVPLLQCSSLMAQWKSCDPCSLLSSSW